MYQSKLYENPRGRYTRWFSFENPEGKKGCGAMKNHGHKGDAARNIAPGEKLTLIDCEGPGILHHMWCTYNQLSHSKRIGTLWLEICWDGAETPAVSAPFDEFFCQALATYKMPFENALFSNPEGRSCNFWIPMPFQKRAKVSVINKSEDMPVSFYFCIEAEFGMELPEDTLYFHCIHQPRRKTVLGEDFEILPKVSGTGRFLGTNIQMQDGEGNSSTWFGEGEVKVYLDGDEEYPTLVNSGTEDYVLSAYGQGEFANAYSGCTLYREDENGVLSTAFYRLHVEDPVYFSQDCRVTIQQLGGSELTRVRKVMHSGANIKVVSGGDHFGKGYNEDTIDINNPDLYYVNFLREDYLSSVAYLYLDRPVL